MVAAAVAVPSHASPGSVVATVVTVADETGIHDAVIESSPESTAALHTCRDWAVDSCLVQPGGERYLEPGQDTHRAFGWIDADGVWIAAGCSLDVGSAASEHPVDGPRWFKITGLFGLTHELRYTC